MTDIDGSWRGSSPIGPKFPIVKKDENGDGEMDKSTIYLDIGECRERLDWLKGGHYRRKHSLWVTQENLEGMLKADTQ